MAGVAYETSLAEVAQRIRELDDFIICGHVSPDGDCLGSQLALYHALKALGKNVQCILAKNEPVDFGLRFLPGLDEMVPAASIKGTVKTFVAVDVPHAERMAYPAASLFAHAHNTICLDHHQSSTPMAQVSYVDDESPAAAQIIWELLGHLGMPIDRDMATCCYTGLMTDTGRFQYQNTNEYSFISAAEMVKCGIDVADIAREVYQNRSRSSLDLEARALERMEFNEAENGVFSYLTLDDFRETGAQKADAEPLVNTLRSIRGVRVACMLREQSKGIRGSLRAKDETDVSLVASEIGGGGHKAAAGFTFDGTMDGARARMREYLATL